MRLIKGLLKIKFVVGRINSIKCMFSTILKRKLTDNQVSNIFINAIYDSVDSGWMEIATLINEDPSFVKSPQLSNENSGLFGLIVIVGNLSFGKHL